MIGLNKSAAKDDNAIYINVIIIKTPIQSDNIAGLDNHLNPTAILQDLRQPLVC